MENMRKPDFCPLGHRIEPGINTLLSGDEVFVCITCNKAYVLTLQEAQMSDSKRDSIMRLARIISAMNSVTVDDLISMGYLGVEFAEPRPKN